MSLVHSSDVYPKDRNKYKYHYSIGIKQLGAANAILKNVQWPNMGLKASSILTPENSLCLRITKKLEWISGKEKNRG